ncbi:1-acylglycerol-3-phosphate O-acyltransferase [Coprinopsis cinerea AmutBmut pab1-1]|nr:1-acylglycerol-3-phosphate O-acyltransferase [Coprinopsis cinerea AmutBmut pab1-1]
MSFLLSIFKPLAYMSVPIFLLKSLAQASPLARYYLRSVAYAGTMATVASCSIFIAATFNILGKKHDVNHWVARFFYETASRALNVRVEVEGEEYLSSRPSVMMANHQSFLDILILGRLFPKQASIVSKKSLQFSPLGPFMTMSGAVFIDRGNNSRAVKSLNDAGNLIKKLKISIWMFPEGTRHLSEKNEMLPLKKGGFHLAINAGIPIVPIVAENYHHLYHKGFFGEGVIKVKVLPPIPTVGLTAADASSLAVRVHEVMEGALREISRPDSNEKDRKQPQTIAAPSEQEKASPPSVSPETPSSDISGISGLDFGSSSVSLSSSVASLSRERSDNGAETEEDEGMILVGRPSQQ